MQKRNVQWLPIVASIGIGAATYSVMTGRGGQLANMIPGIAGMTGSQQNQQSQQMQGQQNQQSFS